jgi:hypothetical protein
MSDNKNIDKFLRKDWNNFQKKDIIERIVVEVLYQPLIKAFSFRKMVNK